MDWFFFSSESLFEFFLFWNGYLWCKYWSLLYRTGFLLEISSRHLKHKHRWAYRSSCFLLQFLYIYIKGAILYHAQHSISQKYFYCILMSLFFIFFFLSFSFAFSIRLAWTAMIIDVVHDKQQLHEMLSQFLIIWIWQ